MSLCTSPHHGIACLVSTTASKTTTTIDCSSSSSRGAAAHAGTPGVSPEGSGEKMGWGGVSGGTQGHTNTRPPTSGGGGEVWKGGGGLEVW